MDPVTLARKIECEEDGIYFNRFFFKQRFDSKMIVSGHHYAMQNALDRTMLPPDNPDFISRLIINVPPGYTKTEMAVIGYIARGLAINSKSRFLHLSYSHGLALDNSTKAREIIKSEAYQSMWPVQTKADVDSKEIWRTEKGGGVKASAAGGQVTGFRAGHMDDEQFSGALLIDDPLKPDDIDHKVREDINNRFNETIASRVAVETNPIIVIMQPLHWDDLSGYLLRGGSGEKWHHLRMPVIINNEEEYPPEYTHGIPVEHGLPDGWLWPFKHNEKHLTALKAHRRRWYAQYKLRPLKRDEQNCLWSERQLQDARERPLKSGILKTAIAVDPAVSNNEKSDLNGVVVAHELEDNAGFHVEADYTKRGAPEDWAARAIAAYEKHDADFIVIETNQGGDMCESTLRNAGFLGQVIRVRATKGKVLRAEPVQALYGLGLVTHSLGLEELEEEMLDLDPLTGLANGKSPNRVDALVYALTELSGGGAGLEELLALALG